MRGPLRGAAAEAGWSLVREALERDGQVRWRARGHSMRPGIPDGALVTARRIAPERVRIGHVVLVHDRGRTFLHRVVGRRGRLLLTKGDLNPGCDPVFPPDHVLGRAVVVEAWGVTRRLDGLAAAASGLAWAAISRAVPVVRRALAPLLRAEQRTL